MTQKCPTCSVESSDTEVWCPSCGARLGIKERSVTGKLVMWGFIVFNVFFGGVFINSMYVSSTSTPDHITAVLGATSLMTYWGIGALLLGALMLITKPKS